MIAATRLPKEIYIFVGPPGSGKGSVAALCVERNRWKMLSTGNLCRKHIAEQTVIGKEIDFNIKSGKLISDDLISRMVEDWFVNNEAEGNAVILDGYPRTLKQAETFDDFLRAIYNKKLKLYIVQFIVSDETVNKRLSSRFTCSYKECQAVYSLCSGSECAPRIEGMCDRCGSTLIRRVDDEESAIRKRLHIYYQHAQELLEFYKAKGYPFISIDVEKPLELVFEDFMKKTDVNQVAANV